MYFGKSGCIQANDDIIGQSGCIWQKLLYSVKMVVFGKSCCIRAKVVVVGQKWLYSGKSGSILAKVVVFWQKWIYSSNKTVFGEK